jgi:hypothetical protein
MTDGGQEKAIESIRDWSKSLIGLELAAGAGCVVILQQGVGGLPRVFLIAAIVAFGLALATAALILGLTPSVLQQLPLRDPEGSDLNIYDCHVWRGLRLKTVVQLQYLFFAAAIVFFVTWVILKPPPG